MKKFFAIAFVAATLVACGNSGEGTTGTDTTKAADTTVAPADTTAPAADTTAKVDTAAAATPAK